MKLLDEFRQSCRRHYQRNRSQGDHASRARVFAVLYQRHSNAAMYRHVCQIAAILDRVQQEERAHQLRLPLEMR